MKRGEVFNIDGKTFLALGGAMSHDKEPFVRQTYGRPDRWPGRTEGIDWWAQEVPDRQDLENAYRNLDKVGWKVDYVLSHTCPVSQRILFGRQDQTKDPTEAMLQELWDKGLGFESWHFGHFHIEQQVDKFVCHYDRVRPLICEVIHETSKDSTV